MPGMMDTVLNIGLNDATLAGMVRSTGHPHLAWDAYRRLIAGYGEVRDAVIPRVPSAPGNGPQGRSRGGQTDPEDRLCRLGIGDGQERLFVDSATVWMVSGSLEGFVQSAKRKGCSLREFANWLKDVDIALGKARPMNTLLVCSVEAAKGQEFEAIFLPFLEAGVFPARDADPHEERNRFYAAVTRVCDELTLLVPEDEQRVSPYVKSLKVARSIREGNFLDRRSDDNR